MQQHYFIFLENIFNLTNKISFAILFINKFINNKLVFELNLNYIKLFKNFLYAIVKLIINIISKQVLKSNTNILATKKLKFNKQIIKILNNNKKNNLYIIY